MKTNRAAAVSPAADEENDPPPLVGEGGRVRLSTSNNDDNDEDEEMISLGLSRTNSNSGGGAATPGAASMVGTNRKSAFPATPGTPSTVPASRMNQRNSGGGGVPPMRRTPGPVGGAHQVKHRRTPGAGQSHDEADLNRSHARTPVMSGGGNRPGKTPHKLPPASSSSLATPLNKSQNNASDMLTPSVNNISNPQHQLHERKLYTPAHFTLAKNADLHMDSRPDAFSPATIRMTNSLEKILTDDDDYLEEKQPLAHQQQEQHARSQALQQVPKKDVMAADSRNMINNGDNITMFGTYSKTQELYHDPRTQDDIAMAGRGAFRRIQSTGSGSDDDEEMDEMKDLAETSESPEELVDDGSSQEEEEEAEISQINEDEGDREDDNDDEAKTDGTPISRPKPLNFAGLNTSDGGPSSVVSPSKGGAFKPAKRVVLTTTPKPQRTMPRHAAPSYPLTSGHHHGGGGVYYPQPQQGYFMQDSMMGGHPQHHPSNMYEQHQPHPHIQYSQPHHQYAPPQPHHHHHHPSQNFHLPPLSPQNAGFGHIPPVSPLTIPPGYSHGHGGAYHPHSHSNTSANVGGGYHSMHNIHEPGGGDHWWSDGGAVGFDHTVMSQQYPHVMHHPHHNHVQQQQGAGGMGGMIPIPGHASPDFSFHEMSGAVSPFTLPHHPAFPTATGASHPAQHSSSYPHAQQHHHPHHSQGMPPVIHRPASASPRQRIKLKEDQPRVNNNRKTPPSLTPSPTKHNHQSSPSQRGMRPRKDSAASINSAFSGGGDEHGGNLSFNKTLSSPNSSSASILRQALPGLNASTSSEDGLEHSDWFHPSNQNTNSFSHSTMGSGSRKQQHKLHENYSQPKLRLKKGGHLQPLGTNISGASSNNNSQHSVAGERNKAQQQGSKKAFASKQTRDRIQPPHHLDTSRINPSGSGIGRTMGASSFHHGSSVDSGGKHKHGEFVIESMVERQSFKEFGRHFRQRENESLAAARDYALACLSESNCDIYLPSATHWRVYLELADVAKRSNQIDDARGYYRQACALQPRASQGWLEHSKLEEESGNLRKCATILEEGLTHCTTNENLLIRAVKFYERMGDLDQARQLLSRLKYLNIDKSWKTMLEGALLEARAGRYLMAREVLKFLTHNVPWYGPLYLAHTKLERDHGSSSEAFSIVEKGLKELPRYGPLYFQAFRLSEKEDLSRKAFNLPRTMEMVSRADNISRELLWKVHLEAAQMQERAAVLAVEDNPKKLDLRTALKATRQSYAKAIMLCPPNLSWKIWLASGRTEVTCGNTRGARELFLRAHDSVSQKGRSTVLLECARLEEYCGDLPLSRSILCKARQQFGKSDWKVWLSSVNLECRCELRERAIVFAQEALSIHRGTGRLWAALIQLRHDDGELYQMKVLKHALRAVPKSGEVWCEGARIYLNPFSPTFDLQAASRHLSFAARFTPQYGDSFLEQLRLNMIDQWLIPLAAPFINSMHEAFLSCDQMQIEDAYHCIAKHTKNAADVLKTQLKETTLVKKDVLDTSELELRCSSADPNYGHLWFQCRASPIDTAREVITRAKTVMADSINDYSYLYIAAMVRRAGVLMLIHLETSKPNLPAEDLPCPNYHRWDGMVGRHLRSVPSLDKILPELDAEPMIFTSGCVGKNHNWDKLSLTEKRRVLFGSDSLLS